MLGYVVRMIHGAETSLRISTSTNDFARSQLTETGDLLYFQLGNSRGFPGSCQPRNNSKKWQTEKQTTMNEDMGVSENRGTPKSSILIGFSIINHPFWGTTIFGNTHISPTGNGDVLLFFFVSFRGC